MLTTDDDRRLHPRTMLERPCKLFEPRTGRYVAAVTRDLSMGGLLIDVPRLLELTPGDRLHVGVAMKRRQGILTAKEMIEAVVVRALATVDDHTLLAVRIAADSTGLAQAHSAVEAAQTQRLAA